jgi:hypothetical protein
LNDVNDVLKNLSLSSEGKYSDEFKEEEQKEKSEEYSVVSDSNNSEAD